MPSDALRSFMNAVDEINDLAIVARPSLLATASLRLARVAGRAQVVLLLAHFERYFYAVNEEAVYFVNSKNVAPTVFSDRLKLLHSKNPIDELGEMEWERRALRLSSFISEDGWLWSGATNGALLHERLLAWLRTPKPADLVRYYRYWEIEDIFSLITRRPASRGRLWLGVQELVDIRNNIAHGDFDAQPTQTDIRRYVSSACTFCQRADNQLAKILGRLTRCPRPW
jgi:hypothetical protein